MTIGRCKKCKVGFRWAGAPLLRTAYCPHCKGPLQATTHLARKPIDPGEPLAGNTHPTSEFGLRAQRLGGC